VLSGLAFAALCAAMLMPDTWKAVAGYLLWTALLFASFVSFIIAISMAWHYAKKSDRMRFGICLLVMLLAAASAEHFFHQRMNAQHINCPHCGDDDERTDGN
jgi:ABC-type uncharacterized transport system permease subunit